jgi:hypothetical protein
MATRDSPVEQHLYATLYTNHKQDVVRLTQPGFSHNVTMNEVELAFVPILYLRTGGPLFFMIQFLTKTEGKLGREKKRINSSQSIHRGFGKILL